MKKQIKFYFQAALKLFEILKCLHFTFSLIYSEKIKFSKNAYSLITINNFLWFILLNLSIKIYNSNSSKSPLQNRVTNKFLKNFKTEELFVTVK